MTVKASMSVDFFFKRLLEENASNATNAVQEEERTQKRLEEENKRMAEDMRNMQKRIESEQGDLSIFQERQAKAAAQRADLENQLVENESRLEAEEQRKGELQAARRALDAELEHVRRDAGDLEAQMNRVEAEPKTASEVAVGGPWPLASPKHGAQTTCSRPSASSQNCAQGRPWQPSEQARIAPLARGTGARVRWSSCRTFNGPHR